VGPVNTALPVVLGVAQEGGWLESSPGTWLNSPTGWDYGWRRCNPAGNSCVEVAGASDWRYQLTSADVGNTLRVVITASNAAGTTTATSTETSVVAPAPAAPTP